MQPLRAIQLRHPGQDFPLNLPIFQDFDELEFVSPITFFVGDNGCGKSTLLEILASMLRLPTLAQQSVDQHPLLQAARDASRAFRLVRSGSVRRGVYFRSDDVTGFLQNIQASRAEHEHIRQELEQTLPEGWGRDRATGMAQAQADQLAQRYGDDPFASSHGEKFLHLFQQRIHGPGVYLLDEPETPLSPTNQLSLIALIQQAVARGGQFVIATHSPMLMAIPEATILDFSTSPPEPIAWEDVDHVSITRAFLNHPDAFLRHLDDSQEEAQEEE